MTESQCPESSSRNDESLPWFMQVTLPAWVDQVLIRVFDIGTIVFGVWILATGTVEAVLAWILLAALTVFFHLTPPHKTSEKPEDDQR